MDFASTFVKRLQWRRGLRAAVAVGLAIVVCQSLHKPVGWAALGAFEAILVDNGGSYRLRMQTMCTVLLGGAVAFSLGCLLGGVGTSVVQSVAFLQTAAVVFCTGVICFGTTYARVLSQPIASTSVIILVLFFSGFGNGNVSVKSIAEGAGYFVAGGFGAGVISLLLWPLDPFRPARRSTAAAYALLAAATASLAHESPPQADDRGPEWMRKMRLALEEARMALSQTRARTPSRTVWAQNLAVLLETLDRLFARTLILSEWGEFAAGKERALIQSCSEWLSRQETFIAGALRRRPAVSGRSFAGGLAAEWAGLVGSVFQTAVRSDLDEGNTHFVRSVETEMHGARVDLETAFGALEALRAGVGADLDAMKPRYEKPTATDRCRVLLDRWQADWSWKSPMFRHSIRVGVVGSVDVLLLRLLHINHGFWLGMTSIIILQPYGVGTLRRGVQRVSGTVAGGIFAAVVAAGLHSELALLLVVILCAGFTLASYAVDYGVYSFFLTPTFVLLSLRHPRDWQFAGVRVWMTLLGTLIAVAAMQLLWREKHGDQMARLLRAGAIAEAHYLNATLQVWNRTVGRQGDGLALRRRACGLASNAAEEYLDRLLLEPYFGRKRGSAETERALSFTTQLRRLTRTITVLAEHADPRGLVQSNAVGRVEALAERLCALGTVGAVPEAGPGIGALSRACSVLEPSSPEGAQGVTERQLARMERQVEVLEGSAGWIG